MPAIAFQPRDATLSALAGLSWSSGVQVPQFTAADVASLLTVGTGNSNLVQLNGSAQLPAVDGSLLTGALGKFKQIQYSIDGVYASGSTTIPDDDSIPQNTEGTQFYSLAITPSHASNILVIYAQLNTWAGSTGYHGMALFQDSTANALAARYTYIGGNVVQETTLVHVMAAGTTSATTFKLRAGAASGTLYINGNTSARKYGGVLRSGLVILEFGP